MPVFTCSLKLNEPFTFDPVGCTGAHPLGEQVLSLNAS
jgi:hypothetical protein